MYEYQELYHHGVKGQKWGVRRYQNSDGTLTELGKRQQRKETDGFATRKTMRYYKKANKLDEKAKESGDEETKIKAESMRKKANLSAEFDKKVGDIRKSRDIGHKVGKVILQGPLGQRTYDYLLASGSNSIVSTGANIGAGYIGGIFGQMAMSSIVRSSYIKKNS